MTDENIHTYFTVLVLLDGDQLNAENDSRGYTIQNINDNRNGSVESIASTLRRNNVLVPRQLRELLRTSRVMTRSDFEAGMRAYENEDNSYNSGIRNGSTRSSVHSESSSMSSVHSESSSMSSVHSESVNNNSEHNATNGDDNSVTNTTSNTTSNTTTRGRSLFHRLRNLVYNGLRAFRSTTETETNTVASPIVGFRFENAISQAQPGIGYRDTVASINNSRYNNNSSEYNNNSRYNNNSNIRRRTQSSFFVVVDFLLNGNAFTFEVDRSTTGLGETIAFFENIFSIPDRRNVLDKKLLRKLKLHRITKSLCNSDCSICMTKFKYKDYARTLPCEHVFHSKCVDKWLLKQSSTCPVCRKTVDIEKQ